jgi:hypothetical protein
MLEGTTIHMREIKFVLLSLFVVRAKDKIFISSFLPLYLTKRKERTDCCLPPIQMLKEYFG